MALEQRVWMTRYRSRIMRPLTRAALCTALAILPATLVAQDYTVNSIDRFHLYGALGKIVNFAARLGGGGGIHDIQSTTYLAGHKLRHDTPDDATIIDIDAGSITSLDKKQKTYFTMTFDQMAKAAQAMADSMKAYQAQEQGTKKTTSTSQSKDQVKFKTSVSLDRSGEHQTIAGYDATRMSLVITIDATAKPDTGQEQDAGSMVFLIDEWRSTASPYPKAMGDFQRAYAQKVGQEFSAPMKSMGAVFKQDERIKVGFETAAEEMQKAQGTALRSTTYVVVVPPGMKFDRSLVLADAASEASANTASNASQPQEKKGGGFKGLMGKLKSAAEAANKPDTAKSAPPKQSTLLVVETEVQSVTAGAVPASEFQPPAGYQQIGMPMRQP